MPEKSLQSEPANPKNILPVHPDTMGREAVSLSNTEAEYKILASDGTAQLARRKHLLESKVRPEGLSWRERRAAKKAGRLLTPQEMNDIAEIERRYGQEEPGGPGGFEGMSDIYGNGTFDSLQRTREQIVKGAAAKPELVEAIILASMSPYQLALLDQAKAQEPTLTATQWLIGDDEWVSEAEGKLIANEEVQGESNRRLLNFLQAHNYYIEKRQQNPEFLADVEKYKDLWRTGVEEGVLRGRLHPSAANRAKRLPNIGIYEGDYFTTALHGRAAYYSTGTSTVSVKRDSTDATPHELNHALLTDYNPNIRNSIHNSPFIDEVLTDHLAEVFLGNSPADKLSYRTGSYRAQKKLVKFMLIYANNLGADLTLKELTWAYSAPAEEVVGLVQGIEDKLRASLGKAMPQIVESTHVFSYFQRQINHYFSNRELLNSYRQVDDNGEPIELGEAEASYAASTQVLRDMMDQYNAFEEARFKAQHSGGHPTTP